MTFKLIVAGSRSFDEYWLLEEKLLHLLQNYDLSNVEIVSGTANGADKLGEKFALKHGCKIKRFPANWSIGKQAGYIRNAEMAKYADACVVFMEKNGTKGSQHMIDLAKKEGLPLKVILF